MKHAGTGTSSFEGVVENVPAGAYVVEVIASDAAAVNFGRASANVTFGRK